MSEVGLRPAVEPSAPPAMSRGSALLIASLIVVALAALAFWPTAPWSPPRRPAVKAPIVFDEFVNQASPALANPSAPDSAAR